MRLIHHAQDSETVFYYGGIPYSVLRDHKTQAIFCVFRAQFINLFYQTENIVSRAKNYYLRGIIILLREIYAMFRRENHSRPADVVIQDY